METRNAVRLLTSVECEGRHRELLVRVVRICATHADELIPRDSELLRVATHVFSEEVFIEIVVTSRNWSVASIESRSTHELKSLVERESLLDIVYKTLEVAESRMSLVAVVDIFLNAELLKSEHTTDTEENLLLETVLPVATIERVSDWAVELRVHFIVSIEEVELHTTHVCSPYRSVNHIIHIRNVNNERLSSCRVDSTNNRERVEVLCIVVSNLVALHRDRLLEISEAIEETYSTHVYVRVRSLFYVVAGKHSKTTRVNL